MKRTIVALLCMVACATPVFADEDPYISTAIQIAETKAALFAVDLENHDYERLLNYFPGWFIIMFLEMTEDFGGQITEESVNNFLFNGACMYEDYGNTISRLDEIVRVVSFEVSFFDSEIFYVVELKDKREVVFFLMFDQDTLQFVGAFG